MSTHLFFAQATTTPTNFVNDILMPFVPWVLIFLFIWFFVYRNQRRQSTLNPAYQNDILARLAAVESKLDQLIEICQQRK